MVRVSVRDPRSGDPPLEVTVPASWLELP